MKLKSFMIAALTLAFAVPASAQSLEGKKIYINPGHGGYEATATTRIEGQFGNGYRPDGSNATDRWVSTIPYPSVCEEGVWESKCNLWRGLLLRDMLETAGATVKMSRTTNNIEDDRILEEIGKEATSWEADLFLSIHSNAGTGNSNYVMTMFRGADPRDGETFDINDPDLPESEEAAVIIWKHLHANPLTNWSAYVDGSTTFAVADSAIYTKWNGTGNGYHLGVLRKCWVPNVLAECSFHDYKPEAHRFLNYDYSRIVAFQLYTSLCDYFQAGTTGKGIVCGLVKDAARKFSNSYYTGAISGTHDQYTPINGAKVTLSGNGVTQEYTTDNFYNGLFAFFDLEPGDYTVTVEAEGYDTQEVTITCEAAKVNGEVLMMVDPDYDPEAIVSAANVFAYDLTCTSNGIFQFSLNADATNVTLNLIDENALTKSIELGAYEKGTYVVDINSEDIPSGAYAWSITCEGTTLESPSNFGEGNSLLNIANTRGISIDANPANATFGRMYVTSIENNGKTGERMGTGVYVLGADLSDVFNQGGSPFAGGQTWSGNSGPFHAKVGEDGDVFVCDWTDGHSGVWVMDPQNPSADFVDVFDHTAGTRSTAGILSINGVNIHGSINDVTVYGTGDNRVMLTLDEDMGVANANTGVNQTVLRYDIGQLANPWAVAPSKEIAPTDVHYLANANGCIATDGRGGFWVSQYRYGKDAYPMVMHATSEGVYDYDNNMDENLAGFQGTTPVGGMGVSADGRFVAVSGGTIVVVAEASYNEDGTVASLENRWSFEGLSGRGFNIAFDYANNLYVAFNDQGVGCYALPVNEAVTTSARENVNYVSGISDIVVDEEAPVEYYNLQGIHVTNPSAGQILIRKQGSSVKKVVFE